MGDVLYTAGSEGGQRLATRFQQQAPDASLPDYDPDDDGEGALTAFIAAHQDDIAQAVHTHTGDMLAAALAAVLLDATTGTHPTQPLEDAVNALFDQWTGQGDDGSDYAGSLAGDWTATGWNHGEWDAASQTTAGNGDLSSGVTRTWNAVGDSRTREAHAEADGQTVGLHDTFSVGGEDLAYPSDPSGSLGNTLGCRCSISYDLPANYSGSVDDLEAIDE